MKITPKRVNFTVFKGNLPLRGVKLPVYLGNYLGNYLVVVEVTSNTHGPRRGPLVVVEATITTSRNTRFHLLDIKISTANFKAWVQILRLPAVTLGVNLTVNLLCKLTCELTSRLLVSNLQGYF